MGYSDIPVKTDVERLIESEQETQARLTALTDAVNGLGTNLQWLFDNAKGIFQMFSNPQFLAQLPNVMGAMPGGERPEGH